MKFIHNSKYLSILSDLPHLLNGLPNFVIYSDEKLSRYTKVFTGGDSWIKNASFRNLCPVNSHTGASHRASRRGTGEENRRSDAGAIGIMTLTPGETAMIAVI